MFTIELLPADEGDAIWVEYGFERTHRLLIDCGRKTAYRKVAARLAQDPSIDFELFVLTHVDADHITGAVPLLQDTRFGPERVRDVWFNGWRHLNGLHVDYEGDIPQTLSASQGEFFAAVLRSQAYSWNGAFGGFAAVVEPRAALPEFTLPGGLRLTLLGPTPDKLEEMRGRWADDLQRSRHELEPGDYEHALELLGDDRLHRPDVLGGPPSGPLRIDELAELPFDPDTSEPNGSSISFLAELGEKAVLFAADAHAPQLAEVIRRLLDERGLSKLPLAALKMAHHGSARNNSTELLELVDCQRFLISTNGSRHHHPDPAALARVIDVQQRDVTFYFNYRSDETLLWDEPGLQRKYGFSVVYLTDDDRIEL
ncbi:MAG: hypothetical protein KDK91_28110 [Gammaproteobacteria bacterium]|nr:hypothetical protein [Gammaproteobacteria bacterium]